MALSDLGGDYGSRVPRMAIFAVAGALLTALGFGIGGGAWGWVVLAVFVVTVLAGLAVKYGLHRFVAAYLLNVWFIIALGLPTLLSFSLPGLSKSGLLHAEPWQQALAWLVGSAVWIVVTFIMWLARGRVTAPQPVAEIPGDISPRPLTRPIISFAVIRAAAVSATVAIAFGLQLPSAYWMPVAAIIAMKPSLQQSTFVAEQRVAGTVVGAAVAAVAAVVLLAVDNHRRLVCVGGVDPHRELRLVLRRHGRGHPDRHRCAPPIQPHGRGTADPVDAGRRRGRCHRHVPRRPASEARRQSGAASTCSPGSGGVSGQGAVGPVTPRGMAAGAT